MDEGDRGEERVGGGEMGEGDRGEGRKRSRRGMGEGNRGAVGEGGIRTIPSPDAYHSEPNPVLMVVICTILNLTQS